MARFVPDTAKFRNPDYLRDTLIQERIYLEGALTRDTQETHLQETQEHLRQQSWLYTAPLGH